MAKVQVNFSYTGRWLGLEPSPAQRSTFMQEDVSRATEEPEGDMSCSSLYRSLRFLAQAGSWCAMPG